MGEGARMIEISSGALTAVIDPFGAELSSLRDAAGREWMTDADPAYWSGRAPLLFPIVGRLEGDRYRLDGREYPLPQHGFARRQGFAPVEQTTDRATFRLTDNDATRAVYPFAFALDAVFVAEGASLAVEVRATNTGEVPMPASFGYHPAFAWPLPGGGAKEAHAVRFAAGEHGALKGLSPEGLIAGERPSPLEGRALPLRDALFADGALIWAPVESRSVTYGPAAGPSLTVDFPDAQMLGIWTKPGAGFVCIEPWWGIADSAGFAGTIWDKPGMVRLQPGETRRFAMRLTMRGG
jgi:galactose mutarotase-like enzyme